MATATLMGRLILATSNTRMNPTGVTAGSPVTHSGGVGWAGKERGPKSNLLGHSTPALALPTIEPYVTLAPSFCREQKSWLWGEQCSTTTKLPCQKRQNLGWHSQDMAQRSARNSLCLSMCNECWGAGNPNSSAGGAEGCYQHAGVSRACSSTVPTPGT